MQTQIVKQNTDVRLSSEARQTGATSRTQIVNKVTATAVKVNAIPLIDAGDVKTGRRSSKACARYSKYSDALKPHLAWLRSAIADSKDHVIRVKVTDIVKEMGSDFKNKDVTSIYWGTKYSLYKEEIIVTQGTNRAGQDLLIMRTRQPGDVLPESLNREYKKEMASKKDATFIITKVSIPKVEVIKPKVVVPGRGVKRIVTAVRLSAIEAVTPETDGDLVHA